MSKKITNKYLFKTYYNLLLIREVKENSFENIDKSIYPVEEYNKLAKLDLEELNECIKIFKGMIDDALDEAYVTDPGVSLAGLLTEDPYYKIVQMVYDSEEKLNKIMLSKKTDKKLMN
jgi:hypothetical protein